jgi:hypothetical protein
MKMVSLRRDSAAHFPDDLVTTCNVQQLIRFCGCSRRHVQSDGLSDGLIVALVSSAESVVGYTL